MTACGGKKIMKQCTMTKRKVASARSNKRKNTFCNNEQRLLKKKQINQIASTVAWLHAPQKQK